MPRVYVVNFAGHDLTEAVQYGDLRYLTEGKDCNIFDVKQVICNMKEILADADDDDYLLLSGSPVLNIIAFSILVNWLGRINILIFNAKTRTYAVNTISLKQLTMKGDYTWT
jgi:hypothetical protein